jgi:hypothetical protein
VVQGRKGGRPTVVNPDTLAIALARRARGESVTTIAAHLRSGRSTLYCDATRTKLVSHLPPAAGIAGMTTPGIATAVVANVGYSARRMSVGGPPKRCSNTGGQTVISPWRGTVAGKRVECVGLLIGLGTTDLTWHGWLGVAGVLTSIGLFILARERAQRRTLTAMVKSAGPGTFAMDRRRGRTLTVLKPVETRSDVAVVLIYWRHK